MFRTANVELKKLCNLMSSSPLFTIPADLIGPVHYSDDILVNNFVIENGTLALPTGPGLGIELDEEKMRRYTVQSS